MCTTEYIKSRTPYRQSFGRVDVPETEVESFKDKLKEIVGKEE